MEHFHQMADHNRLGYAHSQRMGKSLEDMKDHQTYQTYDLYIRNIPVSVTCHGLKGLFSQSGNVLSCKLLDPKPDCNTVVGFISYGTFKEAQHAIISFHMFVIENVSLRVEFSRRMGGRSIDNDADGAYRDLQNKVISKMANSEGSLLGAGRGSGIRSCAPKKDDRHYVPNKTGGRLSGSGDFTHKVNESKLRDTNEKTSVQNSNTDIFRPGRRAGSSASGTSSKESNSGASVGECSLSPKNTVHNGKSFENCNSSELSISPYSLAKDAVVEVLCFVCDGIDSTYIIPTCADKYVQRINDLISENYHSQMEQAGTFIIGSVCCAYSLADMAFYRARIETIDHKEATVQYVDYGNMEKIPLCKCFPLIKDLSLIPGLAIRCKFVGVDDYVWLKSKIVDTKFLVRTIENHPEQAVVSLTDISIPPEAASKIVVPTMAAILEYCKPPSNVVDVSVSHVDSVNKFYCHILTNENIEAFKVHKREVDAYCNGAPSQCSYELGQLVGVRSLETRTYSRCEIVYVPNIGGKYNIFQIDYGYTDVVPINMIKPLIILKSNLPRQALLCNMDGVKLPQGKTTWPRKSLEYVRSNLLGKRFEAYFTNIASNDQTHSVKLYSHENKLADIAEKIVCLGLADCNEPVVNRLGSIQDDLNVGDKIDIRIILAMDLANFFVQIDSPSCNAQLKKIEAYTDEIRDSCGQPNYVPRDGDIVMAKFSGDQCWYRAIVNDKDRALTVKFIDYGNEENVLCNHVRPIPSKIASYPAQSMRCMALNLPKNHKDQINGEILDDFVILNKAIVMEKLENTLVLSVLMDNGNDFVQALVCHGLLKCDRGDNNSLRSSSTPKCGMKETINFVSPVTLQNESLSSDHLKIKSSVPSKITIESLKETPLTDGELSAAIVSYVNPEEFYVNIIGQESCATEFDNIDELCALTSEEDKKSYFPELNELCVAFSTKFKSWYRAKVVARQSQGSFKVLFIDYGDFDTIDSEKIRLFPDELVQYPPLAKNCKLHGCRGTLANGIWSSVATQEMKNMVMSDSGPCLVKLVIKKRTADLKHYVEVVTNGTINVSASLVDADLAQPICLSYNDFPVYSKLELHNRVSVVISALETPGKFYVVSSSEASYNNIKKLDDALTNMYGSLAPDSCLDIEIGDLVVIQHPDDDMFYRGILETVLADNYSIRILDYGWLVSVKVNRLRPFMRQFLDWPPNSIPVSLNLSIDDWTTDSIKKMKHQVQWNEEVCLSSKIVIVPKSLSPEGVYEIDVFNDKGIMILSDMVSNFQQSENCYQINNGLSNGCDKNSVIDFNYTIDLELPQHPVSDGEQMMNMDVTDQIKFLMERVASLEIEKNTLLSENARLRCLKK